MFDANGKPKAITELEENEAAAIAGFEVHGETIRVTMIGERQSKYALRIKLVRPS